MQNRINSQVIESNAKLVKSIKIIYNQFIFLKVSPTAEHFLHSQNSMKLLSVHKKLRALSGI